MPELILKFKDNALNTYELAEKTPMTIGRRKGNTILIDNLSVSGKHARIEMDAEDWIIRDLDSKNGTIVNETPVQRHALKDGDVITIGKHTLLYTENRLENSDDFILDQNEQDTEIIYPSTKPDGDGNNNASLTFLAGGEGCIKLNKSTTTIGKHGDSDIVVEGLSAILVGDTAATISISKGTHYISSVSGIMKIKLNSEPVQGSMQLSHMDIIKIGPVVLKFTVE